MNFRDLQVKITFLTLRSRDTSFFYFTLFVYLFFFWVPFVSSQDLAVIPQSITGCESLLWWEKLEHVCPNSFSSKPMAEFVTGVAGRVQGLQECWCCLSHYPNPWCFLSPAPAPSPCFYLLCQESLLDAITKESFSTISFLIIPVTIIFLNTILLTYPPCLWWRLRCLLSEEF